jgi:hypothetical protein
MESHHSKRKFSDRPMDLTQSTLEQFHADTSGNSTFLPTHTHSPFAHVQPTQATLPQVHHVESVAHMVSINFSKYSFQQQYSKNYNYEKL